MKSILLVFVVLCGVACTPSAGPTAAPASAPSAAPIPPAAPAAVTQDSPPYAKLAALEAGSPNPPPSTLAAFKTLLGSLATKCWQDSPALLADYAVKSQELLKAKGIALKLSAIVRAADNSIPAGTQVARCSEIFALLVAAQK